MELLENPSPAELRVLDDVDAIIVVEAPENTRNAASLSQERLAALEAGIRQAIERVYDGSLPFTVGQFPTRRWRRKPTCRRRSSPTSSTAPSCSTGMRSGSG